MKRQLEKYRGRISHTLYKRRHKRAYDKIRGVTLSADAANEAIAAALESAKPFFAGRMGSNECSVCWNHVRSAFHPTKHRQSLYHASTVVAGILTRDDERFDKFASVYLAALPFLDLVGTWDVKGMVPLLNKYGSASLQCTPLASLEPWQSYLKKQRAWTKCLKGKKVLVVHPFAQSIEKQYRIRSAIKTVGDIIPEFELITLIPPVTHARQDNGSTWIENLQSLMCQVAKVDFNAAIIGCGAYGLPLGAFVKQLGRQAIHLGGSTQLLFGIRGKRWDEREDFKVLMDQSWVRPLKNERPPGAAEVEGATYW